MTAQDRILSWLREMLNEAERIAQATTPVPVAGKWAAVRDKHADDDAPLTIIQGQNEEDPDYQGYSSNVPVIAHAAEWQDEAEANLHHIALNDPAAVLRRIAKDRELLDDLLTEKHHVCVDNWYTCPAATQERDGGTYAETKGGGACDCGRDERVQRRVRLLAEGWGWTEETP